MNTLRIWLSDLWQRWADSFWTSPKWERRFMETMRHPNETQDIWRD